MGLIKKKSREEAEGQETGTRIEFWTLLKLVQEHISSSYSNEYLRVEDKNLFIPYVEDYVRKGDYIVFDEKTGREWPLEETVENICQEMWQFSFLTPYLTVLADQYEEINVNAWNDVAYTRRDGTIEKSKVHFHSPEHAQDIVSRLLRVSGTTIDKARPIAQGQLEGNNRITAMITPILDRDVGVAISIRLLHNDKMSMEELVSRDMLTGDMALLLDTLVHYGVSVVFAGATSTGKTTLMNALLNQMPDTKRIFTIESGARELNFVHKDENGKITSNVVHTLSTSANGTSNEIKQEDLVIASLRYNPTIVVVGEMRDVEAYAAIEAAMTGHTVVSTVHSGAGKSAYTRISLLTQKKFPIAFETSMLQCAEAFPVVVFTGLLEDNSRRVLDITEAVTTDEGKIVYRQLYHFEIEDNSINEKGQAVVSGKFVRDNPISPRLRQTLIEHGVPKKKLAQFC